jgi:hypothetical protein
MATKNTKTFRPYNPAGNCSLDSKNGFWGGGLLVFFAAIPAVRGAT